MEGRGDQPADSHRKSREIMRKCGPALRVRNAETKPRQKAKTKAGKHGEKDHGWGGMHLQSLQCFVEPAEKPCGRVGDRGQDRGIWPRPLLGCLWGVAAGICSPVWCQALASAQCHRASATSLDTLLSGSAKSPKCRAPDGQVRTAGRNAVFFGQVFVVDAVNAQGAFLHHTSGLVEFACAIRTSPSTQATADAVVFIDQNDAILSSVYSWRPLGKP